jgi:predicted  nucleic acid-binding Zn-ribbon protein
MGPWWQQPFFQVALPIIITFVIATWYQSARINDLRDTLGKRIDDLGKRIDDLRADMNSRFEAVEKRLDRIELAMSDHSTRITMLEERTSPLRR